MRKIVLFVAVLFMTVPAMAVSDVTITCVNDVNEVTVYYASTIGGSDGNLIRAFGLDITVDTANITKVVPVDANYRIFPGQPYGIQITDGEVTGYGTCYDPCDLGDANVTIEMGSLYTMDSNYDPCFGGDPNAGFGMQPGASGTLLKFYVDASCHYTITENAALGGIVMEDPGEDPNVNEPNLCEGDVNLVPPGPFTISGTITGAAPKDTGLDGVTMNGLPGPPVTDVNGFYTASVPGGSSFTVTPSKTQWTFTPASKNYTNVTADALTEDYNAVATECYNLNGPDYSVWVAQGKPDCWCYRKQCNGDINGSSFFGKPVTTVDNNAMKAAFNLDMSDPNWPVDGLCADLNHAAFFGKRVTTVDNNTLKTYFNVDEASVPECSPTYINEWKN